MAEGLPVRFCPRWIVLGLVLFPCAAEAQRRIGEVRVAAIGGWAPAAHPISQENPLGPVAGRYLGGGGLSLTFISGRVSAGPEAILLRGSDRKVYQFGVVGRIGFGHGTLRPYLLAGAGEYFWGRRFVPPPPPGFPGPAQAPIWDTDRQCLTGSVGGGVLIGTPFSPVSLVGEVRFHASFSDDVTAGRRSLLTTSVGTRIAW
jgi:hypothetical protein